MQIYDSIANMEGVWVQQKNNFADGIAKQATEMVSEMDKVREERETSKEEHDFYALCKKFPKVSFVVVDEIGELQWEYSGICDTSTFGNFGQISIAIHKDVMENIDNDWDNVVAMIQWMSDHYDEIVGHAKATSSFEYTYVTINYPPVGNYFKIGGLSYMQTICSGPPLSLRTFGEGVEAEESLNINEQYLRSFLMKIQNNTLDKLFEIGEGKQEHKTKTASKAVEEYQEHFVYTK